LDTNVTNGGVKGIEVNHWAKNGTINNHTANSNSSHGIEIYGSDNVDITNSNLANNGGYGLYIHDITWSDEYPGKLFGRPDATVTNTYGFVDGNTISGSSLYDIAVDVTDANAWDAAQYTSALNTYGTLYEINGTFPEGPTSPNAFDLTVTVNGYNGITDGCTGTLDLQNPNEVSGNLRAQTGDYYGSDACNIEIIHTDPTTQFSVYITRANPGSMSDGTNTFADIANASATDCVADTGGNTNDEELGYRIQNVSVVSGVGVRTDGECSVAYNATATAPNEYLFDIEYENADEIIRSTGSVPYPVCFPGDCSFDLKVAANVAWGTYADTTYDESSVGGAFTTTVSVVPYP
jgi:hypothetical protein